METGGETKQTVERSSGRAVARTPRGTNERWRISSGISRRRIPAIPISDKRIIRKSEKAFDFTTFRGSEASLPSEKRERNAADPLGDVSTSKLDSDDRSPFPYGSRSIGGWREVVAAKLIFERGPTPSPEPEGREEAATARVLVEDRFSSGRQKEVRRWRSREPEDIGSRFRRLARRAGRAGRN